MKRIAGMITAAVLLLSGCSDTDSNLSSIDCRGNSTQQPKNSYTTDSDNADDSNSDVSEPIGDDISDTVQSKQLVAYFAYSENMGDTSSMSVDAVTSASLNASTKNTEGNLQIMAQEIQDQKGADVFHIIMTNPYDPDYSTMLPRATNEMRNKDYPELAGKIEKLDDYDVIYLGLPVWNAEIPPAIHTFLEENDLSGKKIVLFGIHLGSRFGRMETQLKEIIPDADFTEGFTINASTANADVKEQFSEWLQELDV